MTDLMTNHHFAFDRRRLLMGGRLPVRLPRSRHATPTPCCGWRSRKAMCSRCRSRCRTSFRARRRKRKPRATSPPSSPITCKRSGLFAPIDPAAFTEKIVNSDAVPRFPDWRVINAQALVTGRITKQGDGRLKAEFRLWDVFAGQQLDGKQYFTAPDNWRRIAHIISDAIYRTADRREGLLRQPHRLRRRDRAGATPHQAARHHGSGRRRRALSHARRRSGADAAFQSVDARNHLYVLWRGTAARLSAQHRNRAARSRRQFPRHEFRAALLARRPARHHEYAAGRRTRICSSWTCARSRPRG